MCDVQLHPTHHTFVHAQNPSMLHELLSCVELLDYV
jgi:hypothetical protein